MASNTPNFGLYKKDPVADGNDTFNIQTMLNDNWDKLDAQAVKKGTGIAELVGGTLASRPDPGVVGRYYFAQDTGEIYLDSGTEWVLAAASQADLTSLQNEVAAHQADDAPHGIGDKSTLLTTEKSTIVGAVNELFTDVSNGKGVIASAIADMGQLATGSDTFAQLAAKIRDISDDANAGVGDVLSGKTFYQGGVKRTGTIPSKGAATITPGTTNQIIVANQFLSGAQTILGSANLLSGNIKRDVDIFGVNGTLDYGPYLRPYDLGIENIAIVNGYSQDITGSGSVTKESNRIKFYYSGVGERSVVTDTTVNLTTIKYILVDWEISGSYQPTLYLVASTTKIAGVGTSNANVMVYDHARNFSILDVSSLSGYFYIRVHLISVNGLGVGTGYLHRILLV